MPMNDYRLKQEAYDLLRDMVAIPSFSREEDVVADMLCRWLEARGLNTKRFGNNILVVPAGYSESRPTLLLNSHLDTVKPAPSYTFDPFSPGYSDDEIRGLGSNDAGASVVSLIAAYRAVRNEDLGFNLVLALSAQEEVGGEGGMRLLLPSLRELGIRVDMAVVGEPTGLQAAVAERGLVVLDCETAGVTGHAARYEGVNAIYRAISDIEALRSYRFERESSVLGPIKVSVTMIEAGRQHNVVPDICKWVVDVRTTDAYSNTETATLIQSALSPHTSAKPRSTRVHASVIDSSHPLVQCGVWLGAGTFVSPTTSDMSLMYDFPSLKIGPGDSARSHRADEFVRVSEIQAAIDFYTSFLRNLHKFF